MKNERELDKLIIGNKPVKCDLCNGKMFYFGGGRYKCEACDYIALDDFGKVKEYIEEHGPSSAGVISQATGVDMKVIGVLLKTGRVEIPEGSKYFLKCEKCGCSIRYGRYCPECVKVLADGIREIFREDVGERPKFEINPDMKGRMHFL